MAKSNRGGRGAQPTQPVAQQATQQTQQLVVQPPAKNARYSAFTDADANAMIKANSDTLDDPDFEYARKVYVSDANPNGDGFSFSQNLNYKLDNGIKLDANEAFMNTRLQNGMIPLSKNSTMFRAAHDDILRKMGVSDYTKLSQAQLEKALVGKEVTTTSYTSWSYDQKRNPFLPGQKNGGGREVYIKSNMAAGTQVFFGSKLQTEVVSNIGTRIRVKKVYFDGTYATPRGKGRKPRIVLEVESY